MRARRIQGLRDIMTVRDIKTLKGVKCPACDGAGIVKKNFG